MQLASPRRSRPVGRAAAPPRIAGARPRDRSGEGDVAEALDAIGLAEHGADLLVERQRRLVALARALVIGAGEGRCRRGSWMQLASPSTSPTFW